MQTKNKVLFDSSALFALIRMESGYEQLEGLLASSCISAVNLSEIVTRLAELGIADTEIKEIVDEVIPEILPFTHKAGFLSGILMIKAKELGIDLSLGDIACIATGIINNMVVYTTNPVWQELQLDDLSIVVIS